MTAEAPNRGGKHPAAKAGMHFPRTARLLKHSDFERVYKQGRRHFSPHMTVFFLAQPNSNGGDRGGSRIGFTVGRVLGGAVQRNRIKRKMREGVRLRRSILEAKVDIVINPKKSVLTLEFTTVLEEIGKAFAVITKKLAEQ
jgi:ribonuclease P protein component